MVLKKFIAALTAATFMFSLAACSKNEPFIAGENGDTHLIFRGGQAPSELQVWTVEEGDGPVVSETDTVMAHYVGQVWDNSTPFDSSFERGVPSLFSLQSVVEGWTKGLSGQKVGSKVVLSIPPELGYGSDGNPDAGIGGDDTIAFYVEIVNAYSLTTAGDPNAKEQVKLEDLPVTITGGLGEPTSVAVKDGEAEPTESEVIVLALGTGDQIGDGDTVIYQMSATSWDGSQTDSTFGVLGPQSVLVSTQGNLPDLVGKKVGSRVLLLTPSVPERGQGAAAYVIDIIDSIPA